MRQASLPGAPPRSPLSIPGGEWPGPPRALAPLTLSALDSRGADGADPQRGPEDDGRAALRDHRGQHGAESAPDHPGGVWQVRPGPGLGRGSRDAVGARPWEPLPELNRPGYTSRRLLTAFCALVPP